MWLPIVAAAPDVLPWEISESTRRRAGEEEPAPFDMVRVGSSATYHRGTELVERGSVGRFAAASATLDLRVERYLDAGPGIGLALFLTPTAVTDGFLARGEVLAGFGVADWEGDIPGVIALSLGAGGDYLVVGTTEPGRLYGLGRARLTLWMRRDVTLGFAVDTVPLVASQVPVAQHEHRFELATSHGMFELGAGAAFTFLDGGEPARPFTHTALGGFVGVVVR